MAGTMAIKNKSKREGKASPREPHTSHLRVTADKKDDKDEKAERPVPAHLRFKILDHYGPFPKQSQFHCSTAKYRLFGGAAGPGKTKALLMEAILQALDA